MSIVSNRAAARLLCAFFLLVLATTAGATIFIVPDDAEMVAKSDAIVSGVIIGARAVEVEPGYVETEYDLALDRVLKGPMNARTTMSIRSPGGSTGKYMTRVEASAHFREGDHVLLFLTRHRGGWTPTDLTLGKFRFAQTSRGYGVVVRDAEDIVGWDRDGKVHKEKIRLEPEFLEFIREQVAGGDGVKNRIAPDYEVEASEVLAVAAPTLEEAARAIRADAPSAPSATYAAKVWTCNGLSFPARWRTSDMTAGVQFKKNATQNLSGAGDGGVSTIQNALGAWTNDCNSAVNITYAGTTTESNVSNGFGNANTNTVVFNDPNSHIAGNWGGSGTIAICFSRAGITETFDGSEWAVYFDTDIVFQNGYTAAEPSLNTAMTHELGHAIGLRHADFNWGSCIGTPTTPPCTLSCTADPACSTGECASSAIMTAVANSAHGFNLQTWDINGAMSLYPGGSCVTLGAPTNLTATADGMNPVAITWVAGTGTPTGYKVWRKAAGDPDFVVIATLGNVNSHNDGAVSSGKAYLYRVTATATGAESAPSNQDFAVAMSYTDSTITAGSTTAKAAHITDLRTCVNAMRQLAGSANDSFTAITAGSSVVSAAVLTELRTKLNTARGLLGATAFSFTTDGTVIAGATSIKKAHIDEMRNAVR